uniref:Putative basic-leucine zipper transcription factor o n=1 Tax=Nyssomyia neivai TaxID=330878 RepID=A0A1L8DI56_9DIPT
MKMSVVSNNTNSLDPLSVHSRVFVGNLNTFQCSKTDVEKIFQRYGRLLGISMHKGYAFVQYTNPFDARKACHGEDGRTVLSQVLDVNLVSEPKAHQVGRKKLQMAKIGQDFLYTSALFQGKLQKPMKRQRLMQQQQHNRLAGISSKTKLNLYQLTQGYQHHQILFQQHKPRQKPLFRRKLEEDTGSTRANGPAQQVPDQPKSLNFGDNFKVYSNADTLICGNCREHFSDLKDILNHKKTYCQLRMTCKCQEFSSDDVCKETFTNPWDLMVHAQTNHSISIYELDENPQKGDFDGDPNSTGDPSQSSDAGDSSSDESSEKMI